MWLLWSMVGEKNKRAFCNFRKYLGNFCNIWSHCRQPLRTDRSITLASLFWCEMTLHHKWQACIISWRICPFCSTIFNVNTQKRSKYFRSQNLKTLNLLREILLKWVFPLKGLTPTSIFSLFSVFSNNHHNNFYTTN